MTPQLNYKILGQGSPIIILHGLFGMLDNWMNMAKRLEAEGYMVILVDQRDHGRSPHTDEFSYALLSEDLFHFMDENWIHNSILIGHSMGGKTSLQFVSEHESMISKLLVIDIGLKKYTGGHQDVFDALFAIDIKNVQNRDEVQSILMKKLNDLGTVLFLMKNLTRNKVGGFEWKMNLPLLYQKYQNILSNISFSHSCETETLFIRGDRSNYILDDDWSQITEILPNAQLKTITDAGHWVHVDQPDELFNTIIDFIRT